MLSIIFIALFYAATLIMVGGLSFRIWTYATTPLPLNIVLTPAPVTRAGVVRRIAKEVLLFAALFKSNKWIWLFGWVFHVAMLLALLRHLRYFTDPVWWWVTLVQPFGIYAGFAMFAGLFLLWMRRFFVDRVRYISNLSDHLMLVLLLAITASGLAMKFVIHTDIIQLKTFMLGLFSFNWQTMPSDPILVIHLGLVVTLMLIFPFSKLLHVPGIFFSPTLNQIDNAREKRHIARFVTQIEASKQEAGN